METPLKKDRCNSDAEDPELEKIYLDQSNPSARNGPDYKRYLKGGFVLSVISITVGVALHIIEYAMRANSLGKNRIPTQHQTRVWYVELSFEIAG